MGIKINDLENLVLGLKKTVDGAGSSSVVVVKDEWREEMVGRALHVVAAIDGVFTVWFKFSKRPFYQFFLVGKKP